ncbi:hypothetical protein P2G88_17535 [Aliiglaciecola sp. CAU 1673]|uniref:hypothetical protein n=1 Tax=Aliiglaciecola sp. CAU 1673 TaxID=3032595 RepID=UPI0023DAFF60|nr:hypothetical protein [Aliiglaciecola sp. CAU 1673]MDF2180061.1 hypothetical protein [Aliiglaciecola sp. CAU 1673]
MNNTTIEMVSYKLKTDASIAQLRETHEGINAFCRSQPGFIYRSLSKDAEDTWHDIVYWQDMNSAKAAADAFMQNETAQHMLRLLDESTLKMRHMQADTEVMSAQC